MLLDLGYCLVLSQLRIPRLRYSAAVILLQVAILWFLDGLMFGGINFNIAGGHLGSKGSSGEPSHRAF